MTGPPREFHIALAHKDDAIPVRMIHLLIPLFMMEMLCMFCVILYRVCRARKDNKSILS